MPTVGKIELLILILIAVAVYLIIQQNGNRSASESDTLRIPKDLNLEGYRKYVAKLEHRLELLENKITDRDAERKPQSFQKASNRSHPRKVFFDLGANCGNSYLKLKGKNQLPGVWEVYLWEANPQLVKYYLNDLEKRDSQVTVVPLAAWIENKKMSFFLTKGQENITDITQFKAYKCNPNSNYQPAGASSLFSGMGTGSRDDGKRKGRLFQAGEEINVDAVDFNEWLVDQQLTSADEVILKIDIEGAEIPLLKHLLQHSQICMVDTFYIEWHSWLLSDPLTIRTTKEFEDNFLNNVTAHCGGAVPTLGKWH